MAAISIDKAEFERGLGKRSRRISDDEYENYRDEISNLYLKEGKSREEIRKVLAIDHGFSVR